MKTFALTVLFCMLAAHTAWCDPVYLVSDVSLEPYSYIKDEAAAGIDVDIIREAARRSGVEVKIGLFPWKRALMMLETGEADGAFSLFHNMTREQFAHYSKNAVHISELGAFMAKDSLAIYRTIQDIYGKPVFIVAGFSISHDFDQAVREKKIKPAYVLDARDGLTRLLQSNEGCFISNRASVLYHAATLGLIDKIEEIPPVVEVKRPAYLAFSNVALTRPGKEEALMKLDAALGRMRKDGTIRRINRKYFR